jgi:hypothetical protein
VVFLQQAALRVLPQATSVGYHETFNPETLLNTDMPAIVLLALEPALGAWMMMLMMGDDDAS